VATSEPPYRFEQFDGYAVITFYPQLNDSQWADIERVGSELLERLKSYEPPKFTVDLSNLNYMGSAMVALIVRLWKSVKDRKKGRMVIINQHDMIFEVLKLAGLHKVWTIVRTRDEGVRELGVSGGRGVGAVGPAGEGNVLFTIAGIVAIAGAAAGLALLLSRSGILSARAAQLVVVLFAAVGLIAGMLSALKDSGWRQKLGIGVVAASVLLVLAGILTVPPGGPPATPTSEEKPAEGG
jgi:anti-anti-sigma factor